MGNGHPHWEIQIEIENRKLEPLKVLEKRLRMPAAKIYKMIEKGTKDEWLKALGI